MLVRTRRKHGKERVEELPFAVLGERVASPDSWCLPERAKIRHGRWSHRCLRCPIRMGQGLLSGPYQSVGDPWGVVDHSQRNASVAGPPCAQEGCPQIELVSFGVAADSFVDFRSRTSADRKKAGWRCDEAAFLRGIGSISRVSSKDQRLCNLISIRSATKHHTEIARPDTISAFSERQCGPL
jgi:hypothetical protein